jgi:hypothetical protein
VALDGGDRARHGLDPGVETEKEVNVMYGYLLGAVLMIAAGIAEWFIGVEAAGRSLEDVAKPLTAHEEEAEAPA